MGSDDLDSPGREGSGLNILFFVFEAPYWQLYAGIRYLLHFLSRKDVVISELEDCNVLLTEGTSVFSISLISFIYL